MDSFEVEVICAVVAVGGCVITMESLSRFFWDSVCPVSGLPWLYLKLSALK